MSNPIKRFAGRIYEHLAPLGRDPENPDVRTDCAKLLTAELNNATRSGILPERFLDARAVARKAFLDARRRLHKEVEGFPNEAINDVRQRAERLWQREYQAVSTDVTNREHLEGRLNTITRVLTALVTGRPEVGDPLADRVCLEADELRYRLLQEEYGGLPRSHVEGQQAAFDDLRKAIEKHRK